MKLWELSASEIVTDIKNRKISAYEVTKAHLDRLEQINPKINAVVQEMPEEALKRAKLIDRKIQKNEPLGLLSGVPVQLHLF
jgi:amidase